MSITIEDIWNCEKEHSPSVTIGTEDQILKVREEFFEVIKAFVNDDREELKDETADLLNTVFGLSLHVYKDPEEMSQRIMNAIHKMAVKYGKN